MAPIARLSARLFVLEVIRGRGEVVDVLSPDRVWLAGRNFQMIDTMWSF
jgi:hypothetical protein